MGWVKDKGKNAVQKFALGGKPGFAGTGQKREVLLGMREAMERAKEEALARKEARKKKESRIGKKEGIGPYFRPKDKSKKKEDLPRTDAMKKGIIEGMMKHLAAGKKRIG